MPILLALPGKIFALGVGIYYWARLPLLYRLIFLQVAMAFITESVGGYLGFQHKHNLWIFNLYNLSDLVLTGWCGRLLLNRYKYSYVVTYFLAFLIVWWVIEIYDFGIHHFASMFFTLSCIVLVCVYVVVLFSNSMFTKKIFREPAFWLSVSVILYFGCCLPYFGLYNYLIAEQAAMAKKLMMINRVLNFLRYPLIGIAFITAAKQQEKILNRA